VIVIIRLSSELVLDSMPEGSFLYNFASMNFLKFSSFFFLYCIAVAILVSMFTKAPSKDKVEGLTLGTITKEQRAENKESFNWIDVAASLFVVSIVAWVMIYFS
jgi:SSS family solute:Na+ symporter